MTETKRANEAWIELAGGVESDTRAEAEALFRQEWRNLCGMARLLLDEPGDAEEVVQEAFVQLLSERPRARDPRPWLRMVVMNGARARLRRRQTASRHPVMPDPPMAAADEDVVVGAEQARVRAGLRRLSPRQRECLALRFWYELTYRQIAVELRISEGSVARHIHRAVSALAEELKEEE